MESIALSLFLKFLGGTILFSLGGLLLGLFIEITNFNDKEYSTKENFIYSLIIFNALHIIGWIIIGALKLMTL